MQEKFTGMRQDIIWGGITRSTGEGVCPDGECAELVNLIPDGGSLWPAVEGERVYDFGDHGERRLVYVHRSGGYENWLSYDDKMLFFEAVQETGGVVRSAFWEDGLMEAPDLLGIEAIGNTLIVFSGRGKEYLLYKDGNYTYLGEMPPRAEPSITVNVISRESAASASELNPDPPQSYLTEGTPWQGDYEANIAGVTGAVFPVINLELARSRGQGCFVFPFFLRYALRLYDGSYIYQSAPRLISTPVNVRSRVSKWSSSAGEKVANFDFTVQIYEMHLRYRLVYDMKGWEDIVKGVDFFASEPVWTLDQNGYIDRFEYRDGVTFLGLPAVGEDVIRNKLESTGVFYKVHSLELGGERLFDGDILMKEGGLDNLIFQPQLSDDYNSHCRVTGQCSYVYNSKLHLGGIRQTLFHGFKPFQEGEGNASAATRVDVSWLIKTEGGDAQVCRSWELGSTELKIGLHSFVYYPDPRAYKMIITLNGLYTREVELRPHQRLNGAYALLDWRGSYVETGVGYGPYSHTARHTDVFYPNKLQVSELNNPFTFPVNQIYTIGTGRITGLAAATKALSQGQFGQFPLYVFSQDGIWSLEVGGSAYSVRTPVTRDVCVSATSVVSLDSAVVFASAKGLMVLEGSQVSPLSQVLDGPALRVEAGSELDRLSILSKGPSLSDIATGDRFSDYLRDACIGYDYVHSRLLVCRGGGDYSYLYDLKSGLWCKVSGVYQGVLNAYPECYVSDKSGVRRLSQEPAREDAGRVKVCLITRALKWGEGSTLKRLQRLAVGVESFYGRDLGVVVCGSRDGETYSVLKGWKGGRAPRIGGSGYRYFRVMLSGEVDARCALQGLSGEVEAVMGGRLR